MRKPKAPPTLPRKIWVGTYEFGMFVVPLGDENLDGADGITITEDARKAMYIDSSCDTRRRLEVVLHEISHAINWAYDLADGAEEEMIAEIGGRAWSQIWLDNPRLERWLVHTLARIRKEREADDPPTTESK